METIVPFVFIVFPCFIAKRIQLNNAKENDPPAIVYRTIISRSISIDAEEILRKI